MSNDGAAGAAGWQGHGAGAPEDGGVPPELARASGWRRGLAWAVDFSLVIALAVLLGFFTFNRISAMLTDAPGLAETGVWKVITSDGDLAGAGQALGESLWNRSLRAVQQGFVLLFLGTFLYQFLALAFAGTTLGKALLGLRVVPAAAGAGSRRPARRSAAVRAAVTSVADVGLLALACCLLVAGAFLLAGFVVVLAVVVFLVNGIPAAVGARRSLADRLAGTEVSGGLLQATARRTAHFTAHYTAQSGRAARQAAQRVAEADRTRAAMARGRRLIPGRRPAEPPLDGASQVDAP
ncbi:RDD family protein [Streptomyces sp. NBRC 109706]|uniref:RDD family protein n=1 Tax=Streptomyces sp. NBRC 109706 TaxID=1550035 RepID=UPI000832330E|nr:RDD family protein [Streptomyces sp. NBRC 109706]